MWFVLGFILILKFSCNISISLESLIDKFTKSGIFGSNLVFNPYLNLCEINYSVGSADVVCRNVCETKRRKYDNIKIVQNLLNNDQRKTCRNHFLLASDVSRISKKLLLRNARSVCTIIAIARACKVGAADKIPEHFSDQTVNG